MKNTIIIIAIIVLSSCNNSTKENKLNFSDKYNRSKNWKDEPIDYYIFEKGDSIHLVWIALLENKGDIWYLDSLPFTGIAFDNYWVDGKQGRTEENYVNGKHQTSLLNLFQ